MKRLILSNQDIHTGHLILVNRQYPYRENRPAVLAPVGEGGSPVRMDRCAAALLSKLMEEIRGWREIAPVSGWRSQQEQQEIWDQSLLDNGLPFTETYVAAPGHSEHQTGLAIDLGLMSDSIDFIRPDFPYKGICQTFRERCAEYGFVERYPAGKEDVTGIGHEPWHFRYVGVPHAALMAEGDGTLEEYLAFLRHHPNGEKPVSYQKNGLDIRISYWKAESGGTTEVEIDPERPYSLSGDNVGGFILTEWRGKDDAKAE